MREKFLLHFQPGTPSTAFRAVLYLLALLGDFTAAIIFFVLILLCLLFSIWGGGVSRKARHTCSGRMLFPQIVLQSVGCLLLQDKCDGDLQTDLSLSSILLHLYSGKKTSI